MASKKVTKAQLAKVTLESLDDKALAQLAKLLAQQVEKDHPSAWDVGQEIVDQVINSKEFKAKLKPFIMKEVDKRLPKLAQNFTNEVYLSIY
jgi:hypothetical protein